MKRLNYLLGKLTSFRNIADLQASVDGGYIPVICGRTARHGELIRALRAHGFTVRV